MSRLWRGKVGGDGPITFAPGNLTPSIIAPFTAAIIWRPTNVHAGGLWAAYDSLNNQRFSANEYSDGKIYDSTSGFHSPGTYSATDGWRIDAWTHAPDPGSHSSKSDWHSYIYAVGTWQHIDDGFMPIGPFGPDIVEINIGSLNPSEVLQGEIAVVGMWLSQLTDIQLEGLTTQLSAWMDLSPSALWAFNQTDVTTLIPDLTGGGADQINRVGTVVSASEPPGFNYSLTPPATRFTRVGGAWVPVMRHVRQSGAWIDIP